MKQDNISSSLRHLHSNMFLLIPKKSIMDEFNTLVFTFQYVSINTILYFILSCNNSSFTFQYVSINTKPYINKYIEKRNLHSNMFLLIL